MGSMTYGWYYLIGCWWDMSSEILFYKPGGWRKKRVGVAAVIGALSGLHRGGNCAGAFGERAFHMGDFDHIRKSCPAGST